MKWKEFGLRQIILGAALAAGLAPGVQAQSENALAMAAILEQVGCSLSISDGPEVFESLGLGTAGLEAAGNELLDLGLLQLQGEALVVTTGACAGQVAEAPETMVATLMALRDNDCMLSEADMMATIADVGSRDVVMGHLRDLEVAQLVVLSSEARGALLTARLCQAGDAGIASFAAQVPDMMALPERDRLPFEGSPLGAAILIVERIAEAGCAMDTETRLPIAESLDVPVFSLDVFAPLIEGGVFLETPGPLTLVPELCEAEQAARRAAIREVFAAL